MTRQLGQVVHKHLRQHASLYLFVVILFFMGVIFGTFIVHSLGYQQQENLFYYVQIYIEEIQKGALADSQYVYWQTFFHYVMYIGLIWLLGLSIIGLPLVLILLFMKGVFVGFTVGFLVHQLGWQGLGLAIISIAPQNLIMVPLIIAASVLSISFSIQLGKYLFSQQRSMQKPNFVKYLFTLAVVTVFIVGVSFFETYVSPLLISLVTI